MADRRLTPDKVTAAGITPTALTNILVADTHQVANDGRMMFRAVKAAAVDAVFTVTTPGAVGGNAIADLTVTVPASSGIKVFGPFPPSIYNNSSGDLEFSVSDVDTLTLEVFQN